MKKIILLLAVVLADFPHAYGAENLSIETGIGLHWLKGAGVRTLRYRHDTEPFLFDQPGYVEAFAARWNGSTYRNEGLGFVVGLQPRADRWHGIAGFGVAYLDHTSGVSGTRHEFVVRAGGGYTLGDFDWALLYTHYSNAKPVFRWNGPNAGYDFVTVQLSYALH